jgi:hypothetical protein
MNKKKALAIALGGVGAILLISGATAKTELGGGGGGSLGGVDPEELGYDGENVNITIDYPDDNTNKQVDTTGDLTTQDNTLPKDLSTGYSSIYDMSKPKPITKYDTSKTLAENLQKQGYTSKYFKLKQPTKRSSTLPSDINTGKSIAPAKLEQPIWSPLVPKSTTTPMPTYKTLQPNYSTTYTPSTAVIYKAPTSAKRPSKTTPPPTPTSKSGRKTYISKPSTSTRKIAPPPTPPKKKYTPITQRYIRPYSRFFRR